MYLFNHFINNRLVRILIVAMLIFCIVFGGLFVQYSHALVLDTAVFAIVATVLIACGVVAANDADLDAVVSDFYNSLDSDARDWVLTMADAYKESQVSGGGSFSLKASQAIINAVGSWLGGMTWGGFTDTGSNTFLGGFSIAAPGYFDFGNVPMDSIYNSNYTYMDFTSIPWSERQTYYVSASNLSNAGFLNKTFYATMGTTSDWLLTYKFESGELRLYQYSCYDEFDFAYSVVTGVILIADTRFPGCYQLMNLGASDYILGTAAYVASNATYFPSREKYGEYVGGVTTSFPRDVNASANTTWFPQEVVDSAGSTTSFPTNTASKPLTTDTPLTIPDAGVNSTTGAEDVRSDAGVIEGDVTDTAGWLSKIYDTVVSIPEAIASGVSSLVDALANFFDPSEFSLDFSKFKFGLTEVFPFCIPFDFVKGIKLLVADASGFSFDIYLKTTWFTIDHTVDLAPFRIPILFFRFICDFWFIYILISRTRDWIKW